MRPRPQARRAWRNGARALCWRGPIATEFQAKADAWLEAVIKTIKADDAALHAMPQEGMMLRPIVIGNESGSSSRSLPLFFLHDDLRRSLVL